MEGVMLLRAPSSNDLLLRTAAEISLLVGISLHARSKYTVNS